MESFRWYLRWKAYLFRKSAFHAMRSPNTVMAVFLMYVAFAFWLGDRTAIILALLFFMGLWIYIDYQRGIPQKWKRKQMIIDYQKKQAVRESETQRMATS